MDAGTDEIARPSERGPTPHDRPGSASAPSNGSGDDASTIDVSAHLVYDVATDTSFVLAVGATQTEQQAVVSQRLTIEPALELESIGYGSAPTHEVVRFDAPPGRVEVDYAARVRIRPEIDRAGSLCELPFGRVPADAMPYLNPSRYCPSDLFVDAAQRWFGDVEPGFGRVTAVRDWVETNLDYVGGSTDATDDAATVLVQRAGVCRDFAHVMISLCRALGIPARYVAGYGLGVEPPDFHGFVEVFLSDRWYLMDPTGMAPPNGLVRIAHGRDAADAPFATFSGEATLVDKQVSVSAAIDHVDPDRPTSTT